MKKLLLIFLMACSNSVANPKVETTYHIRFDSTYYHVYVNRGHSQTIYPLSAQTDVPDNEKVLWESDLFWTALTIVPGVRDTIPTINCCSYPVDGQVHTVFAPMPGMIGDTAHVVAWTRIGGLTIADTAFIILY